MKKKWIQFCGFICCVYFLISNFMIVSFASEASYHAEFNCYELDDSTLERLSLFYRYFDFACSGTSAVYMYSDINGYSFPNSVFGNNVPLGESRYYYDYYFVSDAPFKVSATWGFTTDSSSVPHDYGPRILKSALDDSGFYIAKYRWASGPYDELVSAPSTGISFDSASGYPWQADDFVPGEGGITPSASIVYDSTIPSPENLTFKSESVGGFLGVGSKWEHTLSWSNGLASPPLFARVYSVAEVVFADTGQFFEDSTIPLVRAEDGYKAETGRYSVGTDYLSSKIMDGTVLNKVLEYRIQFCRYDADGNLAVGPVSNVHIKQNIFGKYDGYTVTTEYPKDDTDLGQSGGMDDNYTDKWTSDGNHYDDYDKDGNLVGSGTSSDGNFIKNLIDSLLNIPTLINSLFKSLQDMMSGIGELPVLLGKLFSFLPGELIGFVGLAFLVVIVLRIFGR